MEKFLYFADGNGANATTEAYTCAASDIVGLIPEARTETVLYISRSNAVDNVEGRDKIVFTHDDTTNTTGHRLKDISKAIAECSNASPHVNGMVDVVDLDNNIFYSNLSFITGLAVTLNIPGGNY